jgi:OmpA-OmpF porin, OOP family
MRTVFVLLVIAMSLGNASLHAQGLLKKLKQKAEQVTTDALGKKMGSVADKTINGDKQPKQSTPANETAKQTTPTKESPGSAPGGVQSFSRYDFMPGKTILFEENFMQDNIGEFPLKWYTKTKGEVVTLSNTNGQWLRMFPDGFYMAPPVKLKDDYTIEFDVLMNWPNGGKDLTGHLASLIIQLYDGDNARRIHTYDYQPQKIITLNIQPKEKTADLMLSTFIVGNTGYKSPFVTTNSLVGKSGRIVHIAICIQKQRFRAWIDAEKVFDAPEVVAENSIFNSLQLSMGSTGYSPEQIGYYISNVKMAAGVPDTRTKIFTTGKFVTTGISFDINSDKIKPISYPVLKQVADALKEEPAVRINIVGHTDSDGSDKDNLELSKRRAESVKQYLVKEFGVEAERLEAMGKGESEPLKKESTAQDKANNRRVEFIKL